MSNSYSDALFNCRLEILESVSTIREADEVIRLCSNLKLLLTECELRARYQKEG